MPEMREQGSVRIAESCLRGDFEEELSLPHGQAGIWANSVARFAMPHLEVSRPGYGMKPTHRKGRSGSASLVSERD